MNYIDFIKNIGIPEFKSVIGKWGNKIFFLIFILLISLIAMGVANGSLSFLSEKMKDPFMQFVDVDRSIEPIPGMPQFDINAAEKYKKDTDSLKHVKSVFETYAKYERFTNSDRSKESTMEGFILKEDNEFYIKLRKDKLFLTDNKFHNDGWGIIITENFMNDLGIDDDTPYITIIKKEFKFPIPISGVVSKLRSNKDFIMTEKLYSLLYGNSDKIPILKSDSSQRVCKWFIPNENKLSTELKSLKIRLSERSSTESLPHVPGIMIESEDFNIDIKKYHKNAIRVYDYDVLPLKIAKNMGAPDTYTLMFRHPDFVLYFATYIKKIFGINLEESRMETKRNFGFFEKLSNLLSWALIGFSIVSIIFFILNLLLSHINKNKRNLGTLKAFGLPNKHIIALYSTITLFLVTISFVSAFILSDFLGQFILNTYVNLREISTENYIRDVIYLSRNFFETFLYFVLIPTVIIIYRLFKELHKVTPGDLIYGRK